MRVIKRKKLVIGSGADKDKFQNAVLYFAHNCEPQTVGKTKLAKLLYYLDFDHYEKHLEAVTKSRYIHRDFGPVPEQYWEWIDEMKNDGLIDFRVIETGLENPMELIVPMQKTQLSFFSNAEQETLNNVVDRWYSTSGSIMSEFAHSEIPYDITTDGEEIPYQLALHR